MRVKPLEPLIDLGNIIEPDGSSNGRRTTRQSMHGRSAANYDMKLHPMDRFQRPDNWRKRHESLLLSQCTSGHSETQPTWVRDDEDSEDGDSDHEDDQGDEVENDSSGDKSSGSVYQTIEPRHRAFDAKATRSSERIKNQTYHDFRLTLEPRAGIYRQRSGNRRKQRASKATGLKRQKTSHPVVASIHDLNDEGYHIVYDEIPSSAVWAPWQRVKFPEQLLMLPEHGSSIPSIDVAKGRKIAQFHQVNRQDPITVEDDDDENDINDQDYQMAMVTLCDSQVDETQSTPADSDIQRADVVFRNYYIDDPVTPVAQMYTVNPADIIRRSSSVSGVTRNEEEENPPYQESMTFDKWLAEKPAQALDRQTQFQKIFGEDGGDDLDDDEMFSAQCTPFHGVEPQVLNLINAAESQDTLQLAKDMVETSETAGYEIGDDGKSHSSVDQIFRDSFEGIHHDVSNEHAAIPFPANQEEAAVGEQRELQIEHSIVPEKPHGQTADIVLQMIYEQSFS